MAVAGFTQREIKSNALPRNLNKTRALTNEIFRSPHHLPPGSRKENTDSCYHIIHPTRHWLLPIDGPRCESHWGRMVFVVPDYI